MQSKVSNEESSPNSETNIGHIQNNGNELKPTTIDGDKSGVNNNTDQDLKPNGTESGVNDDLPIDKGWAWAILAGAVLYLMVMGGLRKNFGLFFVAYQTRYNADASTTSLLTTVQSSVASVTSLLNMTIGMHYMSNRTSIAIGTFLMCGAYISNAFAPNMQVLMVNFVFEGIGAAMVHSPVLAILVEYFKHKRGLANGLAFSGGSLGNFIFAPIYTFLFDYYGYTGTLLLLSGILLHIFISASLFRPLSSFKTKSTHTNEQMKDVKYTDEGTQVSETQLHPSLIRKDVKMVPIPFKSVRNGHAVSYTDLSRQEVLHKQNHDGLSPLLPRARAWSMGAKQQRSVENDSINTTHKPLNYIVDHLARSEVALYGNDMAEIISSTFNVEDTTPHKTRNRRQRVVKFLKKTLLLVFDTSLLKNKIFLLCLVMCAMFAPSTGFMMIFLVPYAKEQGVPSSERGILLAVVGLIGLMTRLAMAVLVDKKFVKLTTILGTAALINGTLVHFTRLFTTYHSLIGFSVILGLTCDIYQAMYSVVLVEYLTLPKLKSALGFTIMCQGASVAISFLIVGWLRDVTGDYLATFHLLGTMSYIGAITSFLIPVVHKRLYMTIEKEREVLEENL